jgi:hypothetical protein
MALFALDIEKKLTFDPETWTNRYIVEATDLTLALLSSEAIYDAEVAIHLDVVQFTRYRVSDMDPDTDTFVIVPKSDTGARTTTGQTLPLFNVVRVDFPAGTGRPSRKYLRLPIQESEQANGDLDTGLIALVNTDYGTVLGDISAYVDVDGEPLGSGVAHPRVGMRQLRRGSKRKLTPVLG